MCGLTTVGFKLTNVDMSPTFGGTLVGIANTISNTPGILVPMLVTKLVSEHHQINEWNQVFIISAFVFIFGALIFVLFGSANYQKWEPLYAFGKQQEEKNNQIFNVSNNANLNKVNVIHLTLNELNMKTDSHHDNHTDNVVVNRVK